MWEVDATRLTLADWTCTDPFEHSAYDRNESQLDLPLAVSTDSTRIANLAQNLKKAEKDEFDVIQYLSLGKAHFRSRNMQCPVPVTPHTPSGLLAALALSPTLGSATPSALPTISFSPPTPPPAIPHHRHLASNEARQLTLLLTQHLWPVRSSPRALMRESIALSERLHDAGIRWDRHRRVMGMHLRGIWEEGQRLAHGRVLGGHGPME